jgi:hypothetical protein
MGYTTDFEGCFTLDKPLDSGHAAYLRAFAETRRMNRDPRIADTFSDPLRQNIGLPIGAAGEYFVGGSGYFGQDSDNSIIDFNVPPDTQPGLWCQWIPNEDGTAIVWDGGEKFYHYVEWIKYLIEHFFSRWGYTLNGDVSWQGEEHDDHGVIMIRGNECFVKYSF